MASNREELRDEIVADLSAITTDNGYETNAGERVHKYLIFPNEVNEFPTICVALGREELERLDTQGNVWNSSVQVFLVGYFQASLQYAGDKVVSSEAIGEDLLNDIKRVAC